MIYIDNDYTNGAHEEILKRLLETNNEQAPGYGMDRFSINAKNSIKNICQNEDIAIHFLSGGTQSNIIAIASSLRPYQGVVTANSGHINNLEAGAIESIGHRLMTVKSNDGKLYAKDVEKLVSSNWDNSSRIHHIQPGMVYISNPTEVGTIYTKSELEEIRQVCDEHNLLLFMDGARLGYALVAETNDVSLKDLTELCDIYYIGGTKIGALFGEALITKNDYIKQGLPTVIKQKGGLLAKGRALGIQFEVLFENNLYFELSKHGVKQAMRIKEAFKSKGISFKYDTFTNQLFPLLNSEQYKQLAQKYYMLHQGEDSGKNVLVRICTSWATEDPLVEELIKDILSL